MKQQNLSTHGFILVEAAVGVVLFSVLLLLVLQGIGFMVQRVAVAAHRHKALCAAVFKTSDTHSTANDQLCVDAYMHSSIAWYAIRAQSGDQIITLYTARRRV